jgi:twinkle protein
MPIPKIPEEIKRASEGLGIMYNKPTIMAVEYHNNLWDSANAEVLNYLTEERKLDIGTLKYFKIGTDNKGWITIPIYKDNELIDYKFRNYKEKMFHRVDKSETWVINEAGLASAAETKKLIITEGEFDAMAVWQMGFNSVISGTGGAQEKGAAWINRIPHEVEKIYINYDNDEPGKKAAIELAERIGIERCYNVLLPQKDANDFIKAGGTAEQYKKILDNAPKFNIEGVIRVSDVLDDIRKNKVERIKTHLDRFNLSTNQGIPKKSLVVLSGRTGVGKSSMLMNFMVHHTSEKGGRIPCLLISLENDIKFTLKRILEIKWGRPLGQFTDKTWEEVREEMPKCPLYIDVSGKTTNFEAVDKLVDQAKRLYGVEIVGFDHIHYVLDGRYNVTQEVAAMTKNFKLLTMEKDVIVYLISHIRKMKEDSKTITGEDLKDSSALQQLADMVLLVIDSAKGMGLSIDKSRMSRSHLYVPLIHDGVTGVMKDDFNREITYFGESVKIDDTEGLEFEPVNVADDGEIK